MSGTIKSTLARVGRYYDRAILRHGPVPRGVDWKDSPSQEIRLAQLFKIFDGRKGASVNDLGCGYGRFYRYLRERGKGGPYRGIDLSGNMIGASRRLWARRADCRWVQGGASALEKADYTVASGIFNVKFGLARGAWERHVLRVLERMNRASSRGFAFNLLTRHCDAARAKPSLYYADPGHYLDLCLRRFSRDVALLHDYGRYDFTILVRKK